MVDQSITQVLFSTVFGLPDHEAFGVIARTARVGCVCAGLLGSAFVILIPWLLPFFYGHAYDEAFGPTGILTLEAVIAGLSSVLLQAFGVVGRPFVVTLIQGVWLSVTVVLLITLVPRMGLEGAAVALLGSTLFRVCIILVCYKVVLKAALPSLIPVPSDFIYLRNKVLAKLGSG